MVAALALVASSESSRSPVETPAADPVVRVTGLRKSFGDRTILDGVDLAIHPGTAVALIGANGTGKSTLLRLIVRLIEPDAGRIEALGADVTALSGPALRAVRTKVGVVFQRQKHVGRRSVLTNVVHGVQGREHGPRTWLQALAREEVRREALACLEAVGLADRALQRADRLSGGQSQRVAIARMLMQRPEFVLADEPDASLDPRAGEEVMHLLRQLTRERGLGLMVISHHLDHTIAFSDRIVGLAEGKVAFDIPAQEADPSALRGFFDRKPDA